MRSRLRRPSARKEIIGKARQWPQLRLYAAGDMIYFIYFDETKHYAGLHLRE